MRTCHMAEHLAFLEAKAPSIKAAGPLSDADTGAAAGEGVEWLYHAYTAPRWEPERAFGYRRTSIPGWWDQRYNERKYYLNDPAPAHCRRSFAPLLSGPGLDGEGHPPEAKRLYAESGEWGAGCSVTFPLRNIPGAPLGVTSFAWPGAAELLRSPASPT